MADKTVICPLNGIHATISFVFRPDLMPLSISDSLTAVDQCLQPSGESPEAAVRHMRDLIRRIG